MNTRLKNIEKQDWLDLAKKANWSVKGMAKCYKVSVRALELHFRKTMNNTPKQWMSEQRQKRAMELLANGTSPKETAFALGYKHAHHFSREFKRLQGRCPTQIASEASKLRVLV
jgi:transcriptional regulator GlxA family with amidase domain